jgi:hypothetical protein
MKQMILILIVASLWGCALPDGPAHEQRKPATTAKAEAVGTVRLAIDRGLTRPWGAIGTQYDVPEEARIIIQQHPDTALELLETDLKSDDRTRRENAYDYLRRLFIGQDFRFDKAAAIVLAHQPKEKHSVVRALADVVAQEIRDRQARTSRPSSVPTTKAVP